MKKNKNIRLLERFFDGTATNEEVHFISDQFRNNEFEQKWMEEQWNNADEKVNPVVQQKILEQIREKIRPRQMLTLHRFFAIAATVAILIISTFTGYLVLENRSFNNDMVVTVAKGQKADVLLPDGSRVWVNSGSTLMYGSRFNRKERIIHLEGEAYFEVAENENAPFIVKTNGFSVKALGTAFDVKAYPEEELFSVVLINGKVEAGDENSKLTISPNQKVVYNRVNKNMQKTDVDDGKIYTSWMNNRLAFESETFASIASTLERNYNVRITFESETLKNIRYSGTLHDNSLESILQILSITSPLSYRMEGSHIFLKENQKQLRYYQGVIHYQ